MGIPIIYAYFFFFIQIAIWLSITVSRCKIFQKSNERWWKALIPYYNKYIELKIAKKKKFFSSLYLILYIMVISAYSLIIIELLISGYDLLPHASLSNIIGSFLAKIIETLAVVLFWIGPHVVFTINIFKYIGLVRSFNLNGAFAIGLTFTPGIFYPILALGKNQYIENRCSRNNNSKYIKNYYDNQYPLNYDNNRPPKYPLQQIKADIQNQYTENTDIENDLDPNLYR